MRRLLDILLSLIALTILSPVLLVTACIIKISSPGPIFYRAQRAGLHGVSFVMYKFRSMHHGHRGAVITAAGDRRIFAFGGFIRKTKIDELPQLINVLKGDMAIVGPRPEDVAIVEKHYTPLYRESLQIKPGLASPGSIFNYTHGEQFLEEGNSDGCYVEKLLPIKAVMDLVYVRNQSLRYDIEIVGRTIITIVKILVGYKKFDYPREHKEALAILKRNLKQNT